MSLLAITTATAGGFPGGESPPLSFNSTPTGPGPGPRPRPSANTTSFVTESSTFTTTKSSISFSTFSTTGPTVTLSVTPIPASSSDLPLLESNASLTRTNIIITVVLGGVAILLLIIIAILLSAYIRRRRREREDNSPPFTSLAVRSPTFPRNTTQSAPQIQLEDFRGTSLSMGPQRNIYGQQAFTSHPPDRRSRSFSAPGPTTQIYNPASIPGPEVVPVINVQPNTPSVFSREDFEQIYSTSQPSTARLPVFPEELQEGRLGAEAAPADPRRLGVPAVGGGQRASVGTFGSDMGFEHGHEVPEERGQARGVLHETRASSGVFPEP